MVSVLLIGGVAAGVTEMRDRNAVSDRLSAQRPGGTTTSSPEGIEKSTTTAATGVIEKKKVESEIDAVVRELTGFIERVRGLKFKTPVKVTLLDDDAFRAQLLEDEDEPVVDEEDGDAKEEADPSEVSEGVLRALGLIEGDVDLSDTAESFLGDAVEGYYSNKDKALVVRGSKITPYVKMILVHELTHALQDQHFGLDRPELEDTEDESVDGFDSLVEGDAEWVSARYIESLTANERRALEREQAEGSDPADFEDIPQVLIELISFPYQLGPVFVEALRDEGGQALVDQAFRKPPTTLEQIIHPQLYIDGQGMVDVADPKADAEVVDDGVIGEFGFILMLERVPGADDRSALAAAAGWGGDRYTAWRAGERTCVRFAVAMDTERDAGQIRDLLGEWAEAQDDARIDRGSATAASPLTVTACG